MDYNHDMASELIKQNVAKLLAGLPDGVQVVAAAKTRTPEEVLEAVQAGIKIIGENYVKKAKAASTLWAGISLPVKLFHYPVLDSMAKLS
jgi:uncharacterized pyridoxal phosphate-containing UPF0001 family protein